MKIGVIGCGNIGAAHARAYRQMQDLDIVCLDLSRQQAEKLAAQIDAEAGVFPEDLPADIDGASVTTPPHSHYAVVKHLVELGIPTFCEKPLTMRVAAGTELAELASAKNTPLLVGFKMRFESVFRKAKEILPNLGPLYGISVTKCQPYHRRPGGDWIPEVGALFELSSHDLDIVNWLTSLTPVSVSARLDRNEGWSADTRFLLQIEYDGGIMAQFLGGYSEETCFCYRDLTLTFIGRRGYIRIERPDRIVCHLEDFNVVELQDVDTNTFPQELDNFLSVIRGEAVPFITPEEANLVTLVIESAKRSFDREESIEIRSR